MFSEHLDLLIYLSSSYWHITSVMTLKFQLPIHVKSINTAEEHDLIDENAAAASFAILRSNHTILAIVNATNCLQC